jgi:hypothetical protein
MLDSASCGWDHDSSRIRSLLEVLNVNARFYVSIGQLCEEHANGVAAARTSPEALPTQAQYDKLMTILRDIQKDCVGMHLTVSASVLQTKIETFEQQFPKYSDFQQGLASWFSCFNAELESKSLWLVLPHRTQYMLAATKERGIGLSLVVAVKSFPDAFHDAHEAGACFAFERFTACVYHLMRLSEHGLVSVAASLDVPQGKISKGWDGCIQGIHAEVNKISSTTPPDWQNKVKKYNDLLSWFTAIKTGWRNPTSHVPRIYTEQSAAGMFSATITLFVHLTKYGFKQEVMPLDPLMLPMQP